MTTYLGNLTLLANASDIDGDPIVVKQLGNNLTNLAQVTSWPHTLTGGDILFGSIIVYQNGDTYYDDGGSVANHPVATKSRSNGSFRYTVADNRGGETSTKTCNMTLTAQSTGDVTAPVFSSPTAVKNGYNAFTASVAIDEQCDVSCVLTSSATAPTQAQVVAGQDHTGGSALYSETQPGVSTGTVNMGGVIPNAPGSTDYYAHFAGADMAGNPSNVVSAAKFTTDAAPSAPGADATVSSLSALNTQLDSWNNNWAGTIPSGKSISDERYINCDTGAYGSLSRSNDAFAQKVHVRSTNQAGGAAFNAITLNNVSNLVFEYIQTSSKSQVKNGSSNIDFLHCLFSGPYTSPNSAKYGLAIDGHGGTRVSNITVQYCRVEGWGDVAILGRKVDNVTVRSTCFNNNADDDMQFKDADVGLIENNWSTIRHYAPTGAHIDGMQAAKYTSSGLGITNFTFDGNVVYDLDFPNPGTQPYRQGIFCDDYFHDNITITENILICGNTHGITAKGSNYTINYNTVLQLYDGGRSSDVTQITTPGPGPHSLSGNIERSASPLSGVIGITRAQYTTYYGGLRQGGDTWQPIGIGGDISELMPQVGQITHWTGGTHGARNRLKEIIVDGLHPGNDGWPNSTFWQTNWNRHNRITS